MGYAERLAELRAKSAGMYARAQAAEEAHKKAETVRVAALVGRAMGGRLTFSDDPRLRAKLEELRTRIA